MITILNLIRIIYSHTIINKFKNCILDSFIIENIIENHNTSLLNNYESCMWINYLKQVGRCNKWNVYQMYREWLYHKNLYKHNLFIAHTDYVDFEEKQTLITYIRRIIGNCIY